MATGLENLKIYQLAVKLEKEVHQITESFPKEEKYRKVDQMRRSSSSVCDNIAESYGKFSYGAKINSLYIARGEAEEIRRQIERAKDIYIDCKIADKIVEEYIILIKSINGYIKFLKEKQKDKLSNKSTN